MSAHDHDARDIDHDGATSRATPTRPGASSTPRSTRPLLAGDPQPVDYSNAGRVDPDRGGDDLHFDLTQQLTPGTRGAGAPYRDADAEAQVRLALRAAGAAADACVKRAAATRAESSRTDLFRAVADEISAHLNLVDSITIDRERYAAEAAITAAAILRFLRAGDPYLRDKDDFLVQRARDLAGGTSAGVAGRHGKGFGGAARKESVLLALRGARAAADAPFDALERGESAPPLLQGAHATASRQMSYVLTLFREDDHTGDAYRGDVEIASQAIGRLVAWAEHQPSKTSSDDLVATTSLVRSVVGLAGTGWIGDMVDGNWVAPDKVAPSKDLGYAALADWNAAALEAIDALLAWTTSNWTRFLGMTSSNARISWDAQLFEQVASNLLGNVLTELSEEAIKKGSVAAAGALFGSAAGPAGTAMGFVAGMVIETVASVVYDYLRGDDSADRSAATAARRTADLIQAKQAVLHRGAAAGRRSQHEALQAAQSALAAASSQVKVSAIIADARAEERVARAPANPGDLSLHAAMLADWVREHAGNARDGNKDTSDVQWETANQEAFGARMLTYKPDVFAYQSRAEWRDAGLNDDDIQKHFEHLIAIASSRRHRVNAEEVKQIFDGRDLRFRGITDARRLTSYLTRHGYVLLEDGADVLARAPDLIAATCTLELGTDYGTCFVNRWRYDLRFLDGTRGFSLFGLAAERVAQFDVSPT